MSRASASVLIEAPPHDVFAYASDWTHWSDWFAGATGFRPVGRITRGNGSRFRYRAKVFGIPVPIDTEIRDFTEDRGWTGVTRRGPRSETSWHFEPEGTGTRFTFGMHDRLPLLPQAIDRRFVLPFWQRSVERSARQLKQQLESRGAQQPPEGRAP